MPETFSFMPRAEWIAPVPPERVDRPMLEQAWRRCSFVHWPFAPEVVRPLVPDDLDLDVYEGSAWVSLITFEMPVMRPAWVGPVPGLTRGAESHLRTYVVDRDGRRGTWMLSLDFGPLMGALIGRGFLLPYWWSKVNIGPVNGSMRYDVARRAPGDGEATIVIDIGDRIPDDEVENLDHFLTARWIVYGGLPRIVTAIVTDHPRWELRRCVPRMLSQTLTEQVGLPVPAVDPILHYSEGTDARLAWPRPVGSGARWPGEREPLTAI